MLTCVALTMILLQSDAPYHVSGERINRNNPRPILMAMTPDPKSVLIIAKDNELRWVNPYIKSSPPTKTAKLTEYPTFDFSGKEAAKVENARALTEALFGSSDPHPLQGIVSMFVKGDKQFCLTNRLNQFFFYSTETGELVKKVFLKIPFKDYHPFITEFSPDMKMVMVGNTDKEVEWIFSLETGQKVSEVPCSFMDTVGFMPDNKRVARVSKNKLSIYDIASKKPIGEAITLPGKSAGSLVINPDGKSIAFSTYGATGDRAGNFILDLATKQTTKIEPKLDKFPVSWVSQDGTLLMLHEPKWIHFVDAHSGKHLFTYATSFPDVWDRIWEGCVQLSADNSRLLVMPDPALAETNYAIFVDLKQPKGKPVTKVGP